MNFIVSIYFNIMYSYKAEINKTFDLFHAVLICFEKVLLIVNILYIIEREKNQT